MSKPKDYIANIENAERRFLDNPVTLKRAESDEEDKPVIVEGYAAKFNQRADLGWYEEEILPGAFDEVLNDDVRCLKNHDPSLLLARSKSGKGTLKLTIDSVGLKYSFEAPNRTVARDLIDELETGDITQSSFAFRASETIWIDRKDEKSIRQIKKIERLFDVSPVTYPAYQDTTVAKRSFDSEHEQEEINENKRAFDEYDARYMLNQNQ